MDDLIVINDEVAIPRSNILAAVWNDGATTTGQYGKILTVYFKLSSPGTIEYYKTDGGYALEFWEKFTGQRVSWDERVVED